VNRNVGIAVAVGVAIIIGAISFQIYESSYQRSSVDEYYADKDHNDAKNIKHVVYPENPQILYGLTINKDKYLLGENVFIKLQGIPMELKDSVLFFTPEGILYLELGFDGMEKSSMKHYFRPALQKGLDIANGGVCNKEQLIGKWTVIFASLPDERLHFQVLDETLPHSEQYYLDCNRQSIEVPPPYIQPSLGE
tara:strand:- start:90 stop:671 length:582 start_codon:yes stop_codon:yes gene_type:complete